MFLFRSAIRIHLILGPKIKLREGIQVNMRWTLLAVIVISALFAGAVNADCELDGNTYPEGTTYGRYVCQDGEWVRNDG